METKTTFQTIDCVPIYQHVRRLAGKQAAHYAVVMCKEMKEELDFETVIIDNSSIGYLTLDFIKRSEDGCALYSIKVGRK